MGLSETVRVGRLVSGSHEEDKVKRSEINGIIRDAGRLIRQKGYYLPPFAYWTPQDWSAKGEEARDISTQDEDLAENEITASLDGVSRGVKAGETMLLKPGEKRTPPSRLYHEF
jgi:D-lyxose ketol-isomerase